MLGIREINSGRKNKILGGCSHRSKGTVSFKMKNTDVTVEIPFEGDVLYCPRQVPKYFNV
jgi:hypothetical protein